MDYNQHALKLLLTSQLTRWLVVLIPQPPGNPTSPPFEIQWKLGRWCPLDLPGWSTYTPHCCPGLQHLHLLLLQGSHRCGNRSWRWAHLSPWGFHHTCPPLSVTKQKKQEGRREQENRHMVSVLFKVHCGHKSSSRRKISVCLLLNEFKPENDTFESQCWRCRGSMAFIFIW